MFEAGRKKYLRGRNDWPVQLSSEKRLGQALIMEGGI